MKKQWYRARFHANHDDSRPIKWPPPGPFWESGFAGDESYAVVIAFVTSKKQVNEFWPEADQVDIEEVDAPTSSDRFPPQEWWNWSDHKFIGESK